MKSEIASVKETLENIFDHKAEVENREFRSAFETFIQYLNSGTVRAAEPTGEGWTVNTWVKKGILLGFRYGKLSDYSINTSFVYYDKDTYPLRTVKLGDGIRMVPGGTSIRSGSYVAPGVVLMPPSYVNVGAYVDENAMIDSHALVGSCAQIGRRVHLSAAAQIGGVLEPIGALPVIVEDDVLVGGNVGIYEGTVVKRRAVIGAGTILTSSIPVYDLVHERTIRSSLERPLTIPENAVVIPGTRPVTSSRFAQERNLQASCALIVKYRDEKTDAATALETALR
jgi:2,3,4,5-tetrahydropyridine-2-carboxylate N-succinyltransferase